MSTPEPNTGHRARLRVRFQADSDSLSESEMLELLLTYAIPRQDVAPLSCALLERFGSLKGVLAASRSELLLVPGIGEQAATLIELTGRLAANSELRKDEPVHVPTQVGITDEGMHEEHFEPESTSGRLFEDETDVVATKMRTFASDETANALTLIPEAHRFTDVQAFGAFLRERLPYNSVSTRRRRASYIIERFFPDGRLNSPLAYYAARCLSSENLKPVLFYHLLRAEPLVAKVAEELVWPAVPAGQVEREQVREFILRYLPEIGQSSQANVLHALFNAYSQLGIAAIDGTQLRFAIHPGTLPGFLYVLTDLLPRPGMYAFEELENGPMRRWLLWDREWMRRQLYNLQDLGIISKVSEIGTMRQFTLGLDQPGALQRYFSYPPQDVSLLRETAGTDEA